MYLHKVNNSFLANSAVRCTQQLNAGVISPTSVQPCWRYSVKWNNKQLWNSRVFAKVVQSTGFTMSGCSFPTFSCKLPQPADDGFYVIVGQCLRPLTLCVQHHAELVVSTPRQGRSHTKEWVYWKHLTTTLPTALRRSFNCSPCNVLKWLNSTYT